MRMRLVTAILFCAAIARPQSGGQEYRVYADHPRIFLNARRLRLLKRERERQSMRWMQFETLITGNAQMPEPGFAYALYHAVTGDDALGRRAVEWALSPAADVRQSAFVYDWCQDALTSAQAKTLAAKLESAANDRAAAGIGAIRTRALAAIAVADQLGDRGQAALEDLVERRWRQIAAELAAGRDIAPGAGMLALLELLHAVRDNLNIDLREQSGDYFKKLPQFYVSCHYPAPYPAAENEYRIPVYSGGSQPDLKGAALSRAAGLGIVAFDTNAEQAQYVQGWLMQDRFLLRGALGSPYEFLWANPYQPGLSYAHLPLAFHDARSGDLFIRSSWDEDAVWFGLFGGEAQLFREGHITVLRENAASTAKIAVGDTATVALAHTGAPLTAAGGALFLLKLDPRRAYNVEVDDEEMTEVETDRAGTLELELPRDRESRVRIEERTLR